MALIMGVGLAALGLKTPPPRKTKSAMRGHFPEVRMDVIEEEDKEPLDLKDLGPVTEVPDISQPPLLDNFKLELNIHDLAKRWRA